MKIDSTTTGKDQPVLCLNMIVKNEMANLKRCLGAVADYIGCWVIGDTGSSDGTRDFVVAFFAERNLPGELHSVPFHNFKRARNGALDHAYASPLQYDYLLFADADMELMVDDPGFRAHLTGAGYRLLQRTAGGLSYWNTRLVRRDAGARYKGVTHEYVDVPGDIGELQGVWYKDHASGSNRVDNFERDIRRLTAALEQEPENHRYWFSLAQSYREAGRTAEAAETYARRAAMGGWVEEAWYARMMEARCLRDLQDEGGFLHQSIAAYSQRPQRAEPLYDLARYYRERGMNDASVLFCEAGLAIPRPEEDALFLDDFVYTAGLKEEYSIAANYARDPARKDRGHAACNWLALSREVPAAQRELARSNLFFYVGPARALLPSFTARPIWFTPPDGFYPSNPSVARRGDEIVLAQRAVNVLLTEDGQYHTADGAPEQARNFLLRLDDDLEIRSVLEIMPPADLPEPAFPAIRGFQDLRLFARRDALWGCATVRELNSEGWYEEVLARIDEHDPGAPRLTDWRVLRPRGPQRHEKNWMPRVVGNELQFLYLCDPTRILDDRARIIAETTPAIAAEQFRGGSQAIAFDNGWLVLIHEVHWRDGQRFYWHRFVWLDEANVLRGVSRAFFFQQNGIEFAAGLAWHPDGRRLLVSYGVCDRESWIATVDAAEVRRALGDSGRLPSVAGRPAEGAEWEAPRPEMVAEPDGVAVDEKPARHIGRRVKTIGLCMIVKNESQVILRCLESARPLVDYVLIEDTGSADGTQRIIRDYLDRNRLLGEVFDAPWQDFAHNRSLALARLREKEDVDYALVMDADDVLVLEEGFDPACFKESLTADLYNVVIKRPTLTFYRELIASNRKEFNYRGVLHECLVGPPGFSADTAKGFYVSDRQEGARSRDPDKFRKDIGVLEQALYKEKDAWLRARYTFYLAQSYLFSDNKQKALKNYLERAKLGFWDEEIYWSLCHAAGIKHALGHPLDEVLATYARASGVCRRRAEAFHSASRLCRENNRFKEGYKLASRGLAVPQPSLGLFLEPWIYEYGLLDEFAVNAYWIGRYDECLEACERLLEEGKCPREMRERVERNAAFAREKLAAQAVVVATARIGGSRASERDTAVPALDLSRHPVSGRNTRGRRRRKK